MVSFEIMIYNSSLILKGFNSTFYNTSFVLVKLKVRVETESYDNFVQLWLLQKRLRFCVLIIMEDKTN